jgi:F420-dependent oxidoreductase-like protein
MRIHGDAIRFGIHAGQHNGTYADFQTLWRRSEELGYDWVSDFDHFLPIQLEPSGPCFDGPTLLGAMAAQTERIRCGMLVTSVTYRHPAVLANIVATLDHVAGGRLEYGIGAGWYEREHDQYGIRFPRIGERMDMLDETCRILRSMWTQETTTFEGKHWQLKDAWCNPKPVQDHLPLVIGGSGEKRTLRIVAEHADIWNTFLSTPEEFDHKMEVLAGHCADVGRDFGEITRTADYNVVIGRDEAEVADRKAWIADHYQRHAPAKAERYVQQLTTGPAVGTVEQVVETLRALAADGLSYAICNFADAAYDRSGIELFEREVIPALR